MWFLELCFRVTDLAAVLSIQAAAAFPGWRGAYGAGGPGLSDRDLQGFCPACEVPHCVFRLTVAGVCISHTSSLGVETVSVYTGRTGKYVIDSVMIIAWRGSWDCAVPENLGKCD